MRTFSIPREVTAMSLLLLGAVAVIEGLRWQDMQQIKSLLMSHQWSQVEKRLGNIEEQAFCYNLVGRRDVYINYVADHNAIAELYNDALTRAEFVEENASGFDSEHKIEPMMEITWISKADLGGIIFLGHIDPWKDCRVRYGIWSWQ